MESRGRLHAFGTKDTTEESLIEENTSSLQPNRPHLEAGASSAPLKYGLRYGAYGYVGDPSTAYPTPLQSETAVAKLETALTGNSGTFWTRMAKAARGDELIFENDALALNTDLDAVWKVNEGLKAADPTLLLQSALYHESCAEASKNYGAHDFVSYLPTFPEYDDTAEGTKAWGIQTPERPFVYVRAGCAQVGKATQWLEAIHLLNGTPEFLIDDTITNEIERNVGEIDPTFGGAVDADTQAAASLYNNLHLHTALLLQTKAWMAETSVNDVHAAYEASVTTTISSEAWTLLNSLNGGLGVDTLWYDTNGGIRKFAKPKDVAGAPLRAQKMYGNVNVSMHFLIACIYHAMDNSPEDLQVFTDMLSDMTYTSDDNLVNIDFTYGKEKDGKEKNWAALNAYMTEPKLERVRDYFSVTTSRMFAAFDATSTTSGLPAVSPAPAVVPSSSEPPSPAGSGSSSSDPGLVVPVVTPASAQDMDAANDEIRRLDGEVKQLKTWKTQAEKDAVAAEGRLLQLQTEVTATKAALKVVTDGLAAAGAGAAAAGGSAPDGRILGMQAEIAKLDAKVEAAEKEAAKAAQAAVDIGRALTTTEGKLSARITAEEQRANKAERSETRRAERIEAALEKRIVQLEKRPTGAAAPGGATAASAPTTAHEERDFIVVRPCIEHQMLGVVMGRGGKDELGCTFWGQTELSVYDDSMHGPCLAKLPVCLLLTLLRCLAAAFLLRCRL